MFGNDKGYEGEAKIAKAFQRSGIKVIFIANFSSTDKSKIFQLKSKIIFECDFILLTKGHGIYIAEVSHSKPD